MDKDQISKERKLVEQYSREIKQTKGINQRFLAFGWTGPDKVYDGKVHSIMLGYGVDKNLKYDAARRFFFEVIDDLVDKINNQPDLADAFYHFPIDYSDLDIRFSFDYESKGHLRHGDIESFNLFESTLFIYEVENEKKLQMKTEEVSSEIFVLKGFESNTKCIRESLAKK